MIAGVLLASVAAEPDVSAFADAIRELVEGRGPFPSLRATQQAAVAALELASTETARSWASRARDRGWVPRVDVRLGTDADRDVRALGRLDESWTEERGFGADVALRWSLGDVVFADAELRIHRERLARSAAIRLARDRVTELFFRRVEVELELRARPSPTLLLEAARLDGLLVGRTGGAWAKGRTEAGP